MTKLAERHELSRFEWRLTAKKSGIAPSLFAQQNQRIDG
jgi:hypothetical protein